MAEQEPPQDEVGEAEFAARLEEELKRLKISDVLVQTLYTISSLGYHKLGTDHRDLPQARLAIDSLRALLPVRGVLGYGDYSLEWIEAWGGTRSPIETPLWEVVSSFVRQIDPGSAAAVKEAEPGEPKPPGAEPPPAPEDLEPVDDEELGGGG